jgi:small GTP-binding protein
LSRLAEKIENPVYEIAFFGRVSAGKSSLLNRIARVSLLPTGVTPVTAVPTRIRNRPEPGLLVASAGGQLIRYDLDRLAEFVTEEGNPGNEKRLTRVIAELPLALLPNEVVLVDTPGLGSLALQGAAETLAYLPNCDLGVVLVDASSNLQADDIAILDALRAASASALLVLSKADLVEEHELERLLNYTRAKVSEELGITVSVKALSSRPEQSSLLKEWIDQDIVPRIANAQVLSRESNERKAKALARGVIGALEVVATSATADHAASAAQDVKKAETRLRDSATLVEAASSECYRITLRIRERAETAIEMLADRAISHWQMDDSGMALDETWMQSALNFIAQAGADELVNLILPTAEKLSRALEEASRVTPGNRDDPGQGNAWS